MELKSIVYWKLVYPIILRMDKYRGLDFLTEVSPEELNFDLKRAHGYGPSGKSFLKEVVSDFNITPKDSIIDVGCGKGSAMKSLLEFPFARVDGVELSARIADIATQNFKRLKEKRCKVYTMDAGYFRQYDDYNYIYFYNPFPAIVMSEVIDNLKASLQRSDREIVIIYMSPTCNNVITESGVFARAGIYHKDGAWITVYSNRSPDTSVLSANKKMQRNVVGTPLDEALKTYLRNYVLKEYK
jgi:SAM-dependent methyltransferase